MPSSMLDPYGHEKAAAERQRREGGVGTHEPDIYDEPIPTYAESSAQPRIPQQELEEIQRALQASELSYQNEYNAPPPPLDFPSSSNFAPAYTQSQPTTAASSSSANAAATTDLPANLDEPPTYNILDDNQTTFMIYGTFIHTPAGPVYQLSSALDTRRTPFRIRRLRPKEIAAVADSASHPPVLFDRTNVLYEVTDPPLLEEYHIMGKRRTCFPGVLELSFSMNKWRVKHVPRPGAKAKEILSSKRVGVFKRSRMNSKKEEETSEWKDAQGRVVATEVLRRDDQGAVLPVMELQKDLDQSWRELLLSMWVARLWVAFGKEKTHRLGGRLANPTFERMPGSRTMGGGGAVA